MVDWKPRYLNLLAKEISDSFDIDYADAREAVRKSAINTLLDEDPIWVDHYPLSYWALTVYKEVIKSGR